MAYGDVCKKANFIFVGKCFIVHTINHINTGIVNVHLITIKAIWGIHLFPGLSIGSIYISEHFKRCYRLKKALFYEVTNWFLTIKFIFIYIRRLIDQYFISSEVASYFLLHPLLIF